MVIMVSQAWRLGKGLTTSHCRKPACYKMLHRAFELDGGTSGGPLSAW